jgi:hypothetical protein
MTAIGKQALNWRYQGNALIEKGNALFHRCGRMVGISSFTPE